MVWYVIQLTPVGFSVADYIKYYAVKTHDFRQSVDWLFTWVHHWARVTLRKFSLRIEPATSEVKGERSDHCATEAPHQWEMLLNGRLGRTV